jgi:c-di-GMP-binding flagellar brake protein YcgR
MFENYRRYKRYSVSARALISVSNASSERRLTTQVRTISQGGMGFYSNIFLKINTPVSVELMVLSPREWDILQSKIAHLEGKIASISPQGDDFYVGIAFKSEIPYDRFSKFVG